MLCRFSWLRTVKANRATRYPREQVAGEVGGRWHDTAENLVRQLAAQRAEKSHPLLRRSVQLAWSDRWWCALGVATQDALAASLLAHSGKRLVLDERNVDTPELADLLDGQRWAL